MTPDSYGVMFLGLSFDIAGGVVLASGFILKGFDAILKESGTTFGTTGRC